MLSIAHCAPQQPSSTLPVTDIYPVKTQNIVDSKKGQVWFKQSCIYNL
jgi:hypothetical protein